MAEVLAAHRRLGRGGRRWGPVYALPAIVMIVAFLGYPVVTIVYHAFTRWDGLGPSEWIGLRNFKALLHSDLFWRSLRNNALFAISVPIQVVVPLVLAYFIHIRIRGWRVFRATYFLPAVYSTVVVGLIFRLGFGSHGPTNTILGDIGLGALSTDWLGSTPGAIFVIIAALVWANCGYNVVLYLAGMAALDPQVAEAARVDGARHWSILRFVYVPGLRRVIELVLVINTLTAFAYMLTYIYVITNGGPGFGTYDTGFLIYNEAFQFQSLGYACAIGVLMILLVLVFGYVQIRVITKGSLERD
jgi:multiple sugar transport system permease protein